MSFFPVIEPNYVKLNVSTAATAPVCLTIYYFTYFQQQHVARLLACY